MVNDGRRIDSSMFLTRDEVACNFDERRRLLRHILDFDFTTQRPRESKTYDLAIGKTQDPMRPCSRCKKPTMFTTPRGRSIHPSCEGFVDTLTPEGTVALIGLVSRVLPIGSVGMESHEPEQSQGIRSRAPDRDGAPGPVSRPRRWNTPTTSGGQPRQG